MSDFLTDEEMERLSSAAPQQQQPPGDFLTDDEMAQHEQAGPVVSDAQMERMANPDQAAVNSMLQQAVNRGATYEQVVQMARENGVPDPEQTLAGLHDAIRWRQQHGSYNGAVNAFERPATDETEAVKPEFRKTPENEVSGLRAFGEGLRQGVSFGFSDEIDAGIGAGVNSLGNLVGLGNGQDIGDYYRDARDERRELIDDADDQHPWLYNGGQVVGSIAPSLVGGAPATAARLGTRLALEGAAYGAGQSEADNIGGVAQDAAIGGATSLVTGGALNRVGAVVSPRVAPLVDRLMRAGIEPTPTQIMRAGGPIARTVGAAAALLGQRGAMTKEVMRDAERRGIRSIDAVEAAQDAAVAQARALGLNATPRHPDLINDARTLMAPRASRSTNADFLGNLVAGWATGGGTFGADATMAALSTKTGQRVLNGALTGRQGPVPKAIRSIATKLSPLAGNVAAQNTTGE